MSVTTILAIGAVSLIGITLTGWVITTYNFFQSGKINIETQWSNIKTEYQRRFDLFMNLVEAVKSYKKHERGTLVSVTEARSAIKFEGGMKDQMKAMGSLDKFFSKLNVVFERYPELKANEQHNSLMNEVRITEDRINVARTDYNDVVREYNQGVKMFPSNIIAGMFNFTTHAFYINEEVTNKAPKMDLG